MFRTVKVLVVIVSLLLLPEVSSATKMKSTWKNPEATASSLQFEKVIVMVTIKQELTRKVAEDKAVNVIKAGGRTYALPSYMILDASELENKELARKKVEAEGFDGAIIMHYAGSDGAKKYEQEEDWDEYNYFWGFYYPAYGAVYNATETDSTKVYIETMFYSFKENKLIWSGITETKNPKNPAVVVGEIAEETAKYLQKEGLLPKK